MELEKAKGIAEKIKTILESSCEMIVIAGSIRRQKPDVGDLELLCIPKYIDGVDMLDAKIQTMIYFDMLGYRLNKLGRKVYGPKNKLLVHVPSGIGVDIFSTDEQCWWMALVIRTGPRESNITIAKAARAQGWRLKAYGDGFDTSDLLKNIPVHCHSEREVFEVVGLPYPEPWERR